MKENNLNKRTRDIYHSQHSRMLNDEKTLTRIMSMNIDENFFNLKKDYFVGKKVLDAGCGSIIRNSIAFLKMGCDEVTALDLGNDWFSNAYENLKKNNLPKNRLRLIEGNVDDLPFKDQTFDFVSCDGVITHLENLRQVQKAIDELCRVTKKGGKLFLSFMSGGGLIETVISNALKEHYKDSDDFNEFIDNICPKDLHEGVDFVVQKMEENGSFIDKTIVDIFKGLLDEDLCISYQNTIQSETRFSHSQDFIKNQLIKNGFNDYLRLKRYVKRNNLKKFFSPLHYYDKNKFSKILYGEGWCDTISTKEE